MSKPLVRASFSVKPSSTMSVLFLCVVCLFMSVPVHAVDCSTADGFPNTRLSTQADVDNFQTVYGPCDTITRLVVIEAEGGSFTNLFGLNEIITMTDDLLILRSSVASLEGLSNLETIGGRLHIESQLAPSFANLSGLSSLTSLGELYIEDTNFLFSLAGMTSLTSLGGLHIFNARILTNLAGLSEGSAVNQAGLSEGPATNQAALAVGLNMIRDISISSNDQLQTLDGLSPVIGVRTLDVEDNPNLTSISALAGSTYDDSNAFPGFSNLTLVISGNPKLNSLDGVPGMPLALNELRIADISQITSLNVLNGLLEVWGGASIDSNAALSDCSALSNVVDTVDDGFPGPNEFTSDPALSPPDVPEGALNLASNAEGCNSIAEILGSSSEDGVFMDGFETVPSNNSDL